MMDEKKETRLVQTSSKENVFKLPSAREIKTSKMGDMEVLIQDWIQAYEKLLQTDCFRAYVRNIQEATELVKSVGSFRDTMSEMKDKQQNDLASLMLNREMRKLELDKERLSLRNKCEREKGDKIRSIQTGLDDLSQQMDVHKEKIDILKKRLKAKEKALRSLETSHDRLSATLNDLTSNTNDVIIQMDSHELKSETLHDEIFRRSVNGYKIEAREKCREVLESFEENIGAMKRLSKAITEDCKHKVTINFIGLLLTLRECLGERFRELLDNNPDDDGSTTAKEKIEDIRKLLEANQMEGPLDLENCLNPRSFQVPEGFLDHLHGLAGGEDVPTAPLPLTQTLTSSTIYHVDHCSPPKNKKRSRETPQEVQNNIHQSKARKLYANTEATSYPDSSVLIEEAEPEVLPTTTTTSARNTTATSTSKGDTKSIAEDAMDKVKCMLKEKRRTYHGQTFDLSSCEDVAAKARQFLDDYGFVVVKCDDVMGHGKPDGIPIYHKEKVKTTTDGSYNVVFDKNVDFEHVSKKPEDCLSTMNYGYLPKHTIFNWCLASIIEEGRFITDMYNLTEKISLTSTNGGASKKRNKRNHGPSPELSDSDIDTYLKKIYDIRLRNYLDYETYLIKNNMGQDPSSIYQATGAINTVAYGGIIPDITWTQCKTLANSTFQKFMLNRPAPSNATTTTNNTSGAENVAEDIRPSNVNILATDQFKHHKTKRMKTAHAGLFKHINGSILDGWYYDNVSDLVGNDTTEVMYNPLVNEAFFWMARSLARKPWGDVLGVESGQLVAEPQPLCVVHQEISSRKKKDGNLPPSMGRDHYPLQYTNEEWLYTPGFYDYSQVMAMKDKKSSKKNSTEDWVRPLGCGLHDDPYGKRSDKNGDGGVQEPEVRYQGLLALTPGYGLRLLPGFNKAENVTMMRSILDAYRKSECGRPPNKLVNVLNRDFGDYTIRIHMPAGYICIWNCNLPFGLKTYSLSATTSGNDYAGATMTHMPFVGMYVNMMDSAKEKAKAKYASSQSTSIVNSSNGIIDPAQLCKYGIGTNDYLGGLVDNWTDACVTNMVIKEPTEGGAGNGDFLPLPNEVRQPHISPGTTVDTHYHPALQKIPGVLNEHIDGRERSSKSVVYDQHSINRICENGMVLCIPPRRNAAGYLPFLFSKFRIEADETPQTPCLSSGGVISPPLVNIPKINLFSSSCDLPSIFMWMMCTKDTLLSNDHLRYLGDIGHREELVRTLVANCKPNTYCRVAKQYEIPPELMEAGAGGQPDGHEFLKSYDNLLLMFNPPRLYELRGMRKPGNHFMDSHIRDYYNLVYYLQPPMITKVGHFEVSIDSEDDSEQAAKDMIWALDANYTTQLQSHIPIGQELPVRYQKRWFLNLLGVGRPEYIFGHRHNNTRVKIKYPAIPAQDEPGIQDVTSVELASIIPNMTYTAEEQDEPGTQDFTSEVFDFY